MLESRKATYYGFTITMYRIGDHLWISNVLPNAQPLVRQFNYDKMIWIQATYTTNEIENLFNISSHALKSYKRQLGSKSLLNCLFLIQLSQFKS